MDVTNKIIQGLWIGGELSVMEQLSIKSFLENGHDYHLYVYGDVKNIPERAVIKDGNEILPEDKIFTYQVGFGKGSYAGFADYFRINLLKKKGGWWADTDVVCLKPLDISADHVIASSYEGKWGDVANNCVIKLPKGSPLLDYLLQQLSQINPLKAGYGETGIYLLQKAVSELNYSGYIVPHEWFCPITWRAVRKKIVYSSEDLEVKNGIEQTKDILRPLIRPEARTGRISQKSYAVHLWNEIWRQNQIDKNVTHSPSCWYERLKRRYFD